MTNELETINGYLEWLEADVDKSPEAYVRHLEAQEALRMLPHVLESIEDCLTCIEKDSGNPTTLDFVRDTLDHAKRNIEAGGDFE